MYFLLQTDSSIGENARQALKDGKIDFKQKMEIDREIASSCKKLLKPFTKFSIMEIYKSLIKDIEKYSSYPEIEILKTETQKNLNKNIIAYDDLGAILYIITKLNSYPDFNKIKHVLTDESQDFSYLQFVGISNLFKNATFSNVQVHFHVIEYSYNIIFCEGIYYVKNKRRIYTSR